MATIDITDARPNRNSFAEGRLNPIAELWAPPLAPNGTTAAGHVLLREDTIRPVIGGEDPFQPPEPSNLSETFGSRRKLIAGTAIIAALGVAGLTYFFLALPGAKAPAGSSPIAVQSSSDTLGGAIFSTTWNRHPRLWCCQLLLCLSHLAQRPVWFLRPIFPLPSPPRLRPRLLAEPGFRLFAASRRKHQVCTLRKRARSWDCPHGHAVHSYKPGGGLGPGREHPLEGLDQFPISGG